MSSHPLTRQFDRALRMLDALWELIARLEEALNHPKIRRARATMPDANPAWMLDLKYRADGSALVRINERHELELSPKLARLLELLAADTGRCADGTVGWKNVATVRSALMADEPSAASATPRALNQLAYRLRQELARHGVHPGLVQYHRTKQAMRFYLRPERLSDTS